MIYQISENKCTVLSMHMYSVCESTDVLCVCVCVCVCLELLHLCWHTPSLLKWSSDQITKFHFKNVPDLLNCRMKLCVFVCVCV